MQEMLRARERVWRVNKIERVKSVLSHICKDRSKGVKKRARGRDYEEDKKGARKK